MAQMPTRQATPKSGASNGENTPSNKNQTGIHVITGTKYSFGRNSCDFMKNFSVHKANSIKKVYLKPKVARLYHSNSPTKAR